MILPCDFCGKPCKFDDIDEQALKGGFLVTCDACAEDRPFVMKELMETAT